jgi:hypothetical protein
MRTIVLSDTSDEARQSLDLDSLAFAGGDAIRRPEQSGQSALS